MTHEETQVITFEYQQVLSLPAGAGGKPWSEQLAVSVRLLSEAFSSGWYRDTFGKDGNSFIVLLAITMHARPLRGADLDLLVRLGMASRADEDRLYARVTDVGLAVELGMHRETVGACARKLAASGTLRAVAIPPGPAFHDSRGQFAGTRIYLLSGSLENRLRKTVEPRPAAGLHRAGNSDTAAEKPGINIDSDSDGVVVNGAAGLPPALAEFARRKNKPGYYPNEKELRCLQALLDDGFDLHSEILPGIAQAFERTRSPIRSFMYCAQTIRQARQSALARARPGALPPLELPDGLDEAVQILTQATGVPERATLVRLAVLAQQYQPAAAAEDATGAAWVVQALCDSLGQADPRYLLSYATRVLRARRARQVAATQKMAAQAGPAAAGQILPAEIFTFQLATGRMPLRDQVDVVVGMIRKHNLTAAYLKPFWEAWVARDKRRTDLTWISWAVKGEIPEPAGDRGRVRSNLDELIHNAALLAQKGG